MNARSFLGEERGDGDQGMLVLVAVSVFLLMAVVVVSCHVLGVATAPPD